MKIKSYGGNYVNYCETCGNIIINNEIIKDEFNKDFTIQTNFPSINYYEIVCGITVSKGYGDWKAVLIIRDPKTDKKQVRIYNWKRNVNDLVKYALDDYEANDFESIGIRWEQISSIPVKNNYISRLILSLEKLKNEI
ncbi:MAG: hypothetical protein ACTSPY_04105 [Candidatus Helarchaeota archaeon]